MLNTNGLAPRWNDIKNVLKTVVGRRCNDSEQEQAIQRKLNGVTDCCHCPNNEARINQIVKSLEDEDVGARDAYNWFTEVLEDPKINRGDLAAQIKRKIRPGPGPVY